VEDEIEVCVCRLESQTRTVCVPRRVYETRYRSLRVPVKTMMCREESYGRTGARGPCLVERDYCQPVMCLPCGPPSACDVPAAAAPPEVTLTSLVAAPPASSTAPPAAAASPAAAVEQQQPAPSVPATSSSSSSSAPAAQTVTVTAAADVTSLPPPLPEPVPLASAPAPASPATADADAGPARAAPLTPVSQWPTAPGYPPRPTEL
jgi:hypothetical protein